MKTRILLSLSLLILMFASCSKDDGVSPLDIENTSWSSRPASKASPMLRIRFYTNGNGELWDGPIISPIRDSFTWNMNRLDAGKYNVHIIYRRAGQNGEKDGTFTLVQNDTSNFYRFYLDSYVCNKEL